MLVGKEAMGSINSNSNLLAASGCVLSVLAYLLGVIRPPKLNHRGGRIAGLVGEEDLVHHSPQRLPRTNDS